MTPSPCVCGGNPVVEPDGCKIVCSNVNFDAARTPQECSSGTALCPTPEAALRAWNAMQAAVQEGVVGMVPLRWKGEALYANKICFGQLWKNQAENWIWGGLHSAGLHAADTRESARAVLLAHVMGE